MYNAWWYIKTSIVHWLVRNLVTLVKIFSKIFCFCNQSMYNACSPFWDKICTLISYIRTKNFILKYHQPMYNACLYIQTSIVHWLVIFQNEIFCSNVTNQCTNLVPKGRTSIVHWLVTKAENFWENLHQSYQISNQSMYNACLDIPSSIVHWLVNKKCFQTGIQVLYIDWLYFGFINSCQNF